VTLHQQFEAVAWARDHLAAMAKAAHMRQAEIEEMYKRLDAAAETLRALLNERGTLR
jgi:hypothetical protein